MAVVRYRYRDLKEAERKEKDINIFCLVEIRKERKIMDSERLYKWDELDKEVRDFVRDEYGESLEYYVLCCDSLWTAEGELVAW